MGGIYHDHDGLRWNLGLKAWSNTAQNQAFTIQGDTRNPPGSPTK
jgi:hypothetical protein